MRCTTISLDGLPTRFFSAGEGPALLLLHGIGMGGDCYLRNIPALSEHFRVIAPDMLGHGGTALPELHGTPPALAMARHVCTLLDALDVPDCVVVGSSFGGLVAALMYLESRSRVTRLVLAGSGSAFSPPEVQAKALRASMANALDAMKDASLEGLRHRLRNIVHDAGAVDEILIFSQLTTYAQPTVGKAYEKIILDTIAAASDRSGQTANRTHELTLPILMVAGCNDIRAPIELQERQVTKFADARLLKYENCGHFPFLEYPTRFNADVIGFALEQRHIGE